MSTVQYHQKIASNLRHEATVNLKAKLGGNRWILFQYILSKINLYFIIRNNDAMGNCCAAHRTSITDSRQASTRESFDIDTPPPFIY